MLRVIVHKDGQRHDLDLSEGTVIPLTGVSPFFDRDLTKGEQSLPFELPWTERNRRILGSPEMIESAVDSGTIYYVVDVLDDGVPQIAEGKLTLLRCKGSFDYKEGKYIGTITGGESLLGAKLASKTLKSLSLGGVVRWSSGSSREFAELVMKGSASYPFAFAPVRNLQFIDTGRGDYTTELMDGDQINRVMYSASYTQQWTFARPHPANTNIATIPTEAGYNDYRTVPFFNFQFVFKKIFEENGYSVEGDWLDDADLAQLYLYNNRAIDYPSASNTDLNTFIDPVNHVPDLSIAKFLVAVAEAFGFAYFMASGGKVLLRYRHAALRAAAAIDITGYCENEFENEQTELAGGGVTASWDFGSDDSRPGDWVKEINKERVRGQVDKFANIATFTFSPAAATGDLIYVRAENYYYVYDASAPAWNYHSEGQEPVIIGDGKLTVKPAIAPLLQAVDTDNLGVNTNFDMCAIDGTGSYYNYKQVLVETPYPLRFFYIKKFNKNLAFNVPTSFAHNYDYIGVQRAMYSLGTSSSESIFNALNSAYYQRLNAGRIYKVRVLKTRLERLRIDYQTAVRIKNVHYLVVGIEREHGDASAYTLLKLLPI